MDAEESGDKEIASSWDGPSGVGMWHPAPATTAPLTQSLAAAFSDALQLTHPVIHLVIFRH